MGTHARKHGDWEGFDPLLAYRLDDRKVAALPLTSIKRSADGKREEDPTTASKILGTLCGKAFELDDYEASIRSFGGLAQTPVSGVCDLPKGPVGH